MKRSIKVWVILLPDGTIAKAASWLCVHPTEAAAEWSNFKECGAIAPATLTLDLPKPKKGKKR